MVRSPVWLKTKNHCAGKGQQKFNSQLASPVSCSLQRTAELQLTVSCSWESAVRAWGWCEMVASLQGHQPGRRGMSTAGSCYQATWLRTAGDWIWSQTLDSWVSLQWSSTSKDGGRWRQKLSCCQAVPCEDKVHAAVNCNMCESVIVL
jgi:hypothetical protein